MFIVSGSNSSENVSNHHKHLNDQISLDFFCITNYFLMQIARFSKFFHCFELRLLLLLTMDSYILISLVDITITEILLDIKMPLELQPKSTRASYLVNLFSSFSVLYELHIPSQIFLFKTVFRKKIEPVTRES